MVGVTVIGAGVVGLSTAINIQRLLPSYHVTIVAEHIIEGTTSFGAGAIFRPTSEYMPGVSIERVKKWTQDGWNHFSSLAMSEEAGTAGIAITPSFMLSQTEITVCVSCNHSCYNNTIIPCLASQKSAEIENEWVGLRPIRSPLRLEKEVIQSDRGKITVVHNYGHCSDGIGLSWGTSMEAADLVLSCIKSQSKL